jgi:hypothetical protein
MEKSKLNILNIRWRRRWIEKGKLRWRLAIENRGLNMRLLSVD